MTYIVLYVVYTEVLSGDGGFMGGEVMRGGEAFPTLSCRAVSLSCCHPVCVVYVQNVMGTYVVSIPRYSCC